VEGLERGAVGVVHYGRHGVSGTLYHAPEDGHHELHGAVGEYVCVGGGGRGLNRVLNTALFSAHSKQHSAMTALNDSRHPTRSSAE